ncbi:hypothetical protein [Rhodococcus jostii]|uniref:hypothetical protein n=1 Tax=Rhodococcus jostii TaxID=132919 RepID=UPI003646C361
MQIQKLDVIGGISAPQARHLVRHYRLWGCAELAAEVLETSSDRALNALDALCTEGYLNTSGSGDEQQWHTSVKGNALAMAKLGKPIRRSTAERLLNDVIGRAHAYNTDATKLLIVEQIRVFGSYLDPEIDRLGDLDVAITLGRRVPDSRFAEFALRFAEQSGRTFPRYVDKLFWPETDLLRILKSGSRSISITEEDISLVTTRFKTVYSSDDHTPHRT